ncbi:hypothetical protein M409DRAFT_61414 [Zasmidium cellare ATCC 36951]|uniref:Uncharacterized protein n=1 Tax=Zasmidium cellare ATCC 36951 TaxID=1080233 RepID=A0A6A6BXN8_ZASCE|nr:uncharacterized protein M409DRAFT_61414 [Zasmidium cellare ATCC 36951]KAF2158690.1 hypothetical protein M409DRAFT_61414 [Zasmidium cellare ATCC 36951]
MCCPAQPLDAFVPEEGITVAADTVFRHLNSQIWCARCLNHESKREHKFMKDSTESYKGLRYRRYQATGGTHTSECQYKARLTNGDYINNAFEYFHGWEGTKMLALDGILEDTIDELLNSGSLCDRLPRIRQKWAREMQALSRAYESAESGGHTTSGRGEERGGASTQAGNTNTEFTEISDTEPSQDASGRQGPASVGPTTQALTQAPPVHAVDTQKRRAADGEPCASSFVSKKRCNVS